MRLVENTEDLPAWQRGLPSHARMTAAVEKRVGLTLRKFEMRHERRKASLVQIAGQPQPGLRAEPLPRYAFAPRAAQRPTARAADHRHKPPPEAPLGEVACERLRMCSRTLPGIGESQREKPGRTWAGRALLGWRGDRKASRTLLLGVSV